ncbi:MAG: flagellar motor protein MotB [Oscillospiraceae bacterium]|nr:flagellar motor protein MotB [Oscillospiraceae bacterium]
MKRRTNSSPSIDGGRWLTTYSDLMNNLLVLFIALYAMSAVDAEKYKKLMSSFSENFGGGTAIVESQPTDTSHTDESDYIYVPPLTKTDPTDAVDIPEDSAQTGGNVVQKDEFDELFHKINTILSARGYEDKVSVEKMDGYIYFRFVEGVFFYPDQSVLKESSYPIIETIGQILNESYDMIANIDIGGHTANITSKPQSDTDFFSWELSSGRSLSVLKFLVQKCELPQAKMSITGYSCNRPYVEGNSEEYWAQNRRVEIRISKKNL